MGLITIKEYAQRSGISEQAARATISRYPEELAGHIHKQGRTRYLDDEAVAFLEQHLLPRTVVMGDNAQLMEIERLRSDNDELRDKLIQAQELIISLQDRLSIAERSAGALPLVQDEARQLREQLEAEKARTAEAEARANQSIWAKLFRKRKGVSDNDKG